MSAPICPSCQKQPDLIAVHDDPDEGHAWNLYVCKCGAICKEDVWSHHGRRWLHLDGSLTVESPT